MELAREGPLSSTYACAPMSDVVERARAWISGDPDPSTRAQLQALLDERDIASLEPLMGETLIFGTAGIRAPVGPGPARMNRAVVIRTTFGLARYLESTGLTGRPVIVGFDARPTSRGFAEDTAGVLAAAGIEVFYFPEVTPTPLVAFTAKHMAASAAVVITASHNPAGDNGYKVYGPDAAQIVAPVDLQIQRAIESAPPADEVPRVDGAYEGGSPSVKTVPGDILDRYWEELSAQRRRSRGSELEIVYTPIHGCGLDTLSDMMTRAGHFGLVPVPEQARPDGTFPTVAFPNPEEPGAIDLALALASELDADLVLANDPDADRLAVVVPAGTGWRSLSGNEVAALFAEYILAKDPAPDRAIVVGSVVSSPMVGRIVAAHGAHHEVTLTGFKWIVRAGRSLEDELKGRFVLGYEEALGYTIGSTVRDKDGISAAVIFTDLVADLREQGSSVLDELHRLWDLHGLWVSTQTSIEASGPEGPARMTAAVNRLAADPPESVGGHPVSSITDYRLGGEERPPWFGEQDLVELSLGEEGRVLARPSGTEPKLKIYVDLVEPLRGPAERSHGELVAKANAIGSSLGEWLGV